MNEIPIRSASGLTFLFGVLVALVLALWLFITGLGGLDKTGPGDALVLTAGLVLGGLALFSLIGLYTVQPNQAEFLQPVWQVRRLGEGERPALEQPLLCQAEGQPARA